MTPRHAANAGPGYEGTHIVVRGHIQEHEDAYMPVREHIYSSMRMHIYQYADRYRVV